MAQKRIKAYSFYVSFMKVLLPIGIVATLGIAIGWPYLTSIKNEKIVPVDISQPEIKENRMVRPQYISTDAKGQPFQVNADWAKQHEDNHADLINPEGSMTVLEGETFKVKSKAGHYDTEKKVLTLENNVVLTSTKGDVIKTEKAQVDIDKGVISGNSPIEGKGETGEFKGEGFRVEKRAQGKKVITLTGRSRVVINPKKK